MPVAPRHPTLDFGTPECHPENPSEGEAKQQVLALI